MRSQASSTCGTSRSLYWVTTCSAARRLGGGWSVHWEGCELKGCGPVLLLSTFLTVKQTGPNGWQRRPELLSSAQEASSARALFAYGLLVSP